MVMPTATYSLRHFWSGVQDQGDLAERGFRVQDGEPERADDAVKSR